MRKRFYPGICLILALLPSCWREEMPEVPVPGRVYVTAVQGGDGTRTSISHNDDAGRYEFHWEAGDRIDLLEAVPPASGGAVAVYTSDPVPGHCETATFPTLLTPREGPLCYIASYPSGALQTGPFWDDVSGGFLLPLAIPYVQYPTADGFDPAADLLVSEVAEREGQPEALSLDFTRLGTIFKLSITGLAPGTLVHGGSVTLGYSCQGDVLYEASSSSVSYPDGNDCVTFCYTEEDPVTGELTGTPLVADAAGKAVVWLRLRPGVADRAVHVEVDAETGSGERVRYTRGINLLTRNKTVTFREGGLTTLSVQVNGAIAGDGVIPHDLMSIPALYINTPGGVNITSKETWLENVTVRIVGDGGKELFKETTSKVRGRGNSTWEFPKKPYYIKLDKKADLFGTGKSKKYVVLANWLDRTLLRNAVAFEAARMTSLEWTPTGVFVDLYLNGSHKGLYWLGEKIEVESARLQADYLLSNDTSDPNERDFYTDYGYRVNEGKMGLPVEVKYPDRDDYPDGFDGVLQEVKTILRSYGQNIQDGTYSDFLDMDSFCDWYLIHELTRNLEPNHPKSCFQYIRNGRFYAGPVWDFDWGTFVPDIQGLTINRSMYYYYLMNDPAFVSHMQARWAVLKPRFQTLNQYIDSQAEWIRSSEAVNHQMWPITKNVNHDESLSFQDAVDRMKLSLNQRIQELDTVFGVNQPLAVSVQSSGQKGSFVYLVNE